MRIIATKNVFSYDQCPITLSGFLPIVCETKPSCVIPLRNGLSTLPRT